MTDTPTPDLAHDRIRPIRFSAGVLYLLDQRRLPAHRVEEAFTSPQAVAEAIRDMVVRGAPAIGITAAYAMVLACQQVVGQAPSDWRQPLILALRDLEQARPTAVNLHWALERMRRVIEACTTPEAALLAALAEAARMLTEDIAANRKMGRWGASLIEPGSAVLTHCNTGSLATGGFGTALGVIRTAWAEQRIQRVFASETRPWLQGSRLTAWELLQDGIDVTLLCEGAVASLLRRDAVRWIIVGADRIAANGDTANKIGTYSLACLARAHGVRFMVVAPSSTLDLSMPSGQDIPIEERAATEVLGFAGREVAPPGAGAWNPAFDVTPAEYIDAIVTENGIHRPPFSAAQFSSMLRCEE